MAFTLDSNKLDRDVDRWFHWFRSTLNVLVLALSVLLIVWISYDTFKHIDILEDSLYMSFQFWTCLVFILDFFVEFYSTSNHSRYFWRHLLFLLLSIPYLNFIHHFGIELDSNALYFVRFIPLARCALALSIVMGYLSSNAITSLFISYIAIMVLVGYFCSLIFFQREYGVNPQVDSYWSALWWAAMNLSTVGCNIEPVTPAGKIVAVILPICGMVVFPLFTVYLTDYMTRAVSHARSGDSHPDSQQNSSGEHG